MSDTVFPSGCSPIVSSQLKMGEVGFLRRNQERELIAFLYVAMLVAGFWRYNVNIN